MKPQALVVVAGPVGLTMAAELARYGVGVRIVDKAAARTDKSKAIVIWSRTLELIDRMGCGAAFVDAGLKATGANIIAGAIRLAHIDLGGLDTPHPYALMLPQSDSERLMEEHLNSLGVQVERQVELTRFVADEDAVTAFLRRPTGARKPRCRVDDRLRARTRCASWAWHGVRGRYACFPLDPRRPSPRRPPAVEWTRDLLACGWRAAAVSNHPRTLSRDCGRQGGRAPERTDAR